MKKKKPKVNQKKMMNKIIKKVKENEDFYKNSLIVLVGILVIGFGVIGFNSAFSSPNTTTMLKDQEVSNLKFKNATMDGSKLKVEVEALEDKTLNTVEVTYKDEHGNEITTLSGYIGNTLDKGDIKELVVDTDEDISKAYSIEYNVK